MQQVKLTLSLTLKSAKTYSLQSSLRKSLCFYSYLYPNIYLEPLRKGEEEDKEGQGRKS